MTLGPMHRRALPALLVGLAAAQPQCPDGSTAKCPDGSGLSSGFPPCSGGPPVCADGSLAPRPGGGAPGAPQPGAPQGGDPAGGERSGGGPQGGPQGPYGGGGPGAGGGPGGGRPGGPQGGGGPLGAGGGPGGGPGEGGGPPGGPRGNGNAHAAPLLGDVGFTTVGGTIPGTGQTVYAGEDIYGPFEAGFGQQQDMILERIGCHPGSLGRVAGGIDTHTSEKMMAHQCGVELPRDEGGGRNWISLLDKCGGHTREYHFHERMSCLYDGAAEGHSSQIGKANDGGLLYGKFEATGTLPQLDACGGHWGVTPESPQVEVYHYHVRDEAPFTFGCFGPNDDGSLVSVAECRTFYPGCDGNVQTLQTSDGPVGYDDWCPCFDARGSNTGEDIQELPAVTADPRRSGGSSKSGNSFLRKYEAPAAGASVAGKGFAAPLAALAAALAAAAALRAWAARRGPPAPAAQHRPVRSGDGSTTEVTSPTE